MAVVAIVATINMRRMLAGCDYAVMARTASTDHLCVVYRKRWREHIGCMAVFAYVTGLNMRRSFADSVGAVMAAEAVVRDVCVVKSRRYPGNR